MQANSRDDRTMNKEKSMKMAESLLKRAWNKLEEARNQLKKWNHAESISASQESIELSIKATFLLLQKEYPKRHEFKEEEFVSVLDKISKELEHLNFPRLYLLSKFWSNFYTVAKYGYGKFGVGPEKLFRKDEADLALKHAEECRSAASQLKGHVKRAKRNS